MGLRFVGHVKGITRPKAKYSRTLPQSLSPTFRTCQASGFRLRTFLFIGELPYYQEGGAASDNRVVLDGIFYLDSLGLPPVHSLFSMWRLDRSILIKCFKGVRALDDTTTAPGGVLTGGFNHTTVKVVWVRESYNFVTPKLLQIVRPRAPISYNISVFNKSSASTVV